jgi:hypothetical protein
MSDRQQHVLKPGRLADTDHLDECFLGPGPQRGGFLLQRLASDRQQDLPRAGVAAMHRKRDQSIALQWPQRVGEAGALHHHGGRELGHGRRVVAAPRQFGQQGELRHRQPGGGESIVVEQRQASRRLA